MKYFYVTCDKDWADEFSTYSYEAVTEEKLNAFLEILKEKGDLPFRMGFGTNERWDGEDTVAEVWNSDFSYEEITEEHYNVLKLYKACGLAPFINDLVDCMENPEEGDC